MLLILTLVYTFHLQAAVERLDVFDNAGNLLYYTTFIYNQNGSLLGRKFYDRDGELIRNCAITVDALGRAVKELFFDANDHLTDSMIYSYTDDKVSFSFYDNYLEDKLVYKGSYRRGSQLANFDFSNSSGVSTHRLTYEYDNKNRPIKIKVLDASGALTHTIVPSYGTEAFDVFTPAGGKKDIIRLIRADNFTVHLLITVNKKKLLKAVIYNLNGSLIFEAFSEQVGPGTSFQRIAIASKSEPLSRGIYLLKVSAEGTQAVFKIRSGT